MRSKRPLLCFGKPWLWECCIADRRAVPSHQLEGQARGCSLDVLRLGTHKSPWSPSSVGNRGSPGHRYSAHMLTACACTGNHFSAAFRFSLLVIFSLGWKGFSFVLSKVTKLIQWIRKTSLFGFCWSSTGVEMLKQNMMKVLGCFGWL